MRRISKSCPVRLRTLALAAAFLLGGCLSIDSPTGLGLVIIVSGNEQTVQTGAAAAVPLVVRAFDTSAAPMPGVTVTWSVASGGGSVTPISTVTDGSGQAFANYTAGTTTGDAQIRATAEGLTVTFTITVAAPAG
jgi:hypothetical protein